MKKKHIIKTKTRSQFTTPLLAWTAKIWTSWRYILFTFSRMKLFYTLTPWGMGYQVFWPFSCQRVEIFIHEELAFLLKIGKKNYKHMSNLPYCFVCIWSLNNLLLKSSISHFIWGYCNTVDNIILFSYSYWWVLSALFVTKYKVMSSACRILVREISSIIVSEDESDYDLWFND